VVDPEGRGRLAGEISNVSANDVATAVAITPHGRDIAKTLVDIAAAVDRPRASPAPATPQPDRKRVSL
jgi:prophage tail gpP-like protein